MIRKSIALKKALLIAFLLVHSLLHAQDYEWVKFYQGQTTQFPVSLSVDKAGNQYATFNFYSSIEFDSMKLTQSNSFQHGLVIKQDASGKTLWHRVIEPLGTNVYTVKSMFNSKGNLLVFAASNKSIVVKNDTIRRQGTIGYALFMIEFNDTGKIIYSKHLIEGNLGSINYQQNKIFSDSDDNIYLGLIYNDDVKVYNSAGIDTLAGSGSRNIVFKFSPSGGKLEWTRVLPHSAVWINSLKVDLHLNVYIATHWAGNSSFVFNGSTISTPSSSVGIGTIFILDKNGNDKNWFYIKGSANRSTIFDIAVHDTNSVFISGSYLGDSARFDTLWKKNKKYGVYDFFAKYKANGSMTWVKVEDTTYSTSFFYPNYYGSMTNYLDQFFYLSTFAVNHFYTPVSYDGQKYSGNGNGYGFNMKADDKGNILWGFKTYYPFFGVGTDQNNNFYFQGWGINDTIRFGKFKSYANGYDGYIGKTFDYAIYRGNVDEGPYCAGDTLLIPYTRHGNFSDTNTFFAELSDEFGNFSGGERILGKIRTNKDSTIIGLLPIFKVASSHKYRIRIRSTSPQAQSFYTEDTLRLLIYSSDKADPGPTEAICYGDSIKLSTYGGTKWTWSPKYNMDDSTQRQPWAWPIKDTTYKIIIGDSSGCGAPDTAYKKIIIREPLSLTLAFNDTMVCDTSLINLPMQFSGGDSVNYHWRAFSIGTSSNAWNLVKSGKLKLNDTLYHFPKVSITASQKLAIVLDDQCTNKKDTAYVSIQLLNPSELSTKFKDTLLCMGNTISWKAKPLYSLTKYSVWEWRDIANNTVLSTNDSLRITAIKTTKIKLILTNDCTIDSNVFTLNVNPPLKATILSGKANLNDTTLCLGQSLKLFTFGSGGAGKGYNYSWKVNGTIVSNTDSLVSKPGTASNYILTLVLNDNCTIPVDSVSKMITVVESPVANFSYGEACNRTNTDFKFTGAKPNAPISTSFYWDFEGEGSSTVENPFHLLSILGNRKVTLTLVSGNGCKDEISKTVEVKPQAKADFTYKDTCENDSVVFTNLSKDATGYNWYLGDSSNSNKQNVKHKYQNGVNPKTYNVKLITLVKDGCPDSVGKSITIKPAPKADFTWDIACSKTATRFKFTGTTHQAPITTTYHWNFNNEFSSITENPSHLYSVPGTKSTILTLTSSNGCTDTLSKTIEIKPQSKADFTANDVCESDSAVFVNKSKDATSYKWKFGDGQISSKQNPKHKYQIATSTTFNVTLVAEVANGCSDSVVNAVTINKNPNPDFITTQTGNKLELKAKAGYSKYQWEIETTDSFTTTNPNYTYTLKNYTPHKVCLTITDAAGCTAQTCKTIALGISKISKSDGFKIYPNPNPGNFIIEIENPGNDLSIEVYNLLGKLIKIVEISTNKLSYSVDLKVANGIYIVRVRNGESVFNQKVTIDR